VRRLLIANRGEIARRILRSARRHGMKVAVVSTAADAGSRVRSEADQVLEAPSFLDQDAIVGLARGWRADLLHPGYGYLSESASFAKAVEGAGITFVGPSAENILALGHKEAARALAAQLGVPTLSGLSSQEIAGLSPAQWTETLQTRGVDPPYLVKASGGGGGRGMRVAADAQALPAAVVRAAEEARGAFGDGSVFIERLLLGARHVEVQVFGDGRGGGVFFGERECSLQRRHQKLFEEAPSSAVTPSLRETLGRAALALVGAARYRGAGTVEFLLDAKGAFYLLEVNTRLQVEHPVTELAYGIDLVDAQLDLAEGRWPATFPSPETFSVPMPDGQAFEARVLAEDPRNDSLPTPGVIARYQEPSGPGVRVDSGVAAGSCVTTAFDSLLAKLVVHGPDRLTALLRMQAALDAYLIHGCGTNLSFLRALASHPDVLAGRIHTSFVDEHLEELCAPLAPEAVLSFLSSPVVVEAVSGALDGRAPDLCAPHAASFARQAQAFPSFPFPRAAPAEVSPQDEPGGFRLRGAGSGSEEQHDLLITATRLSPFEIAISALGETFTAPDPRAYLGPPASDGAASGEVRAPMAGKVIEVHAKVGDPVVRGQLLFVVESMKMQLEVASPASGVVREVRVRAQQILAGPDTLAVVGPHTE
jgi:acetyl/propionyl-CoA carboxylase alpha subunit